ncbi:hypothetical protein KU6B_11800 [Mameliella alba]|uniref:hypothetical protein n=1 Tax=Mameliella alba TaxID=561184 RepID=UPI0013E41D61|nr:hypothetical protein [Mameliella alba]BBU54915.1 hypothetical protein KU6B_11800 [Mameliella alba]
MKRLVTLMTVLPGAALAHGGHAPVPEAAHGMTHTAPLLGGALIVAALALLIHKRWTS